MPKPPSDPLRPSDDDTWQTFAAGSRDIISRIDARGVTTYASPAVKEVLGYEPEEVVGKNGFDLTHPDDRAYAREAMAASVARGESQGTPVVTRVRHKNGSYVWLESTARAIHDADGKLVGFQGSARDVSARVLAEQALAQSQRDFRTLLEQLPDAACVHRGGTLLYVNAEFSRLIGSAREALVGMRAVDLVHAKDRAKVEGRLTSPARDYQRSFEHVLVRGDGTELVVEVAALPIVWDGALADLSVVRDLTERRRLEAQLNVSERLASIGRLAAAVGHEVKNPLLFLIGNLEVLREEVEAAPPAVAATLRAQLATAREAAERVRTIVNDLRGLTVAASGREGPVDVHRALDAAAASTAHEVAGRARLVKDYGDVGLVLGDERRLVQVFVNLLVNAAHAIAPGDEDANEIRVTTRRSGAEVVVDVADTGCGLPEDATRIFEPFYTTKPSGVGTGLGLAVSHQIVTSFGGTILAERRAPRGAVLRVRLAAAAAARPAAVQTAAEAPAATMRVLLVDDEPHVRATLARLLAPHEVVVGTGAKDAMRLLDDDRRFDAIVCDLHMHDGTGEDVFAHLAKIAPELRARVVFMTGGAYTEHAKRFLESSACPCLEKPFSPNELLAVLERMRRS